MKQSARDSARPPHLPRALWDRSGHGPSAEAEFPQPRPGLLLACPDCSGFMGLRSVLGARSLAVFPLTSFSGKHHNLDNQRPLPAPDAPVGAAPHQG